MARASHAPVVRRSVDTPATLGFNRTRSHGPDRPDPHGYHDHRTALEVLPRALSAVFRVAPLPGFTGLVLARLRRDGRPYKARSADRTALRAFWTTKRVPAIAAPPMASLAVDASDFLRAAARLERLLIMHLSLAEDARSALP